MNCSNCGTALSTGTSFCANCGTPSTPNASTAAPQYAPQPVPASNYASQSTSATEGLAIASLIVSVATLFFTGGIFSFVGAILGHIALSNMKKNGKGGRGLAIAGIAIGWAVTGLWILAGILIFAIAAFGFGSYMSY